MMGEKEMVLMVCKGWGGERRGMGGRGRKGCGCGDGDGEGSGSGWRRSG